MKHDEILLNSIRCMGDDRRECQDPLLCGGCDFYDDCKCTRDGSDAKEDYTACDRYEDGRM